ncbi:hypothetical protein CXB51_017808 [Gossypium anomalum]|uniref:Uncharacterized protein n=1 Tax=Gossypium anomalum TaxID=47600 RepID=A0A8J5YFT0_9ROSI|nr:hypothetical protein CXB51_017808 [Gossypium anomalum]
MGVTPKIAPSMLSSDFANLASEAKRMLDFSADWLHVDIMVKFVSNFASFMDSQEKRNDFQHSNFFWFLGFFLQDRQFVPNLTIGAPVIESLRKHTKAFLDCHCHLMVTNPIDYVEPLGKAGASGFTFHVEVSKVDPQRFSMWFSIPCFLMQRYRVTFAENRQELIQKIKSKAMRPDVALKPGTPIEEVYPLLLLLLLLSLTVKWCW